MSNYYKFINSQTTVHHQLNDKFKKILINNTNSCQCQHKIHHPTDDAIQRNTSNDKQNNKINKSFLGHTS